MAQDDVRINVEAGPDDERASASRREFLQSAAIKGAVAALFGAATFETVMARAMGRIGDVGAARRIGAAAADGAVTPDGKVCVFGCSPGPYDGNGTCTGEVYCNGFTCDVYKQEAYGCTGRDFDCGGLSGGGQGDYSCGMAGGGFMFTCTNSNTFQCNGANPPAFACPTGGYTCTYTCPNGYSNSTCLSSYQT